jgi:hypothetical protein
MMEYWNIGVMVQEPKLSQHSTIPIFQLILGVMQ